jgi:hypothetical protein
LSGHHFWKISPTPLACLIGRKKIAKEGLFLPLEKGGSEGFYKRIFNFLFIDIFFLLWTDY